MINFIWAAIAFGAFAVAGAALWNLYCNLSYERTITANDDTAVLLGAGKGGRPVYLKQRFRTMHAQVIGTTSAGKTESVILPWIIQDLDNGSGMLIIDGKSDRGFLDKLYAYVAKAGRTSDFRLFSLADVAHSATFNPLVGGSPHEVAERVFASFASDNEYYRSVQFKAFLTALRVIDELGDVPTMTLVQRVLMDPQHLCMLLRATGRRDLEYLADPIVSKSDDERRQLWSGLDAALTHFTDSAPARLFNAKCPEISIERSMQRSEILYFQLPSMYYPFLAEVTGKLVLQCAQSAIAKRHLALSDNSKSYYSIFLDDFQDYIYEGFGALLNKSRSANVGVVFSHQALGDLDKVGPAFRNVVLTNTNCKVVMRSNDPDTCEYFAKSFGTVRDEKTTERQQRSIFGARRMGEGSVRDVERYRFHPNEFKGLGLGEGIVAIPHPRGVKVQRIAFARRPDLPAVPLPVTKEEG